MNMNGSFGPHLELTIRTEGDDRGIAELVFGPAGAMPAIDSQGHAALAAILAELASNERPAVRIEAAA
jgi:hypothetical protein